MNARLAKMGERDALHAMIIAIDGPAASGKGTLGRQLAAHYRLHHLDSGLLYRAVAKALLDAGERLDDASRAVAAARGLVLTMLDAETLKAPAVGDAASIVAAIPAVRDALLGLQRDFAARPAGAVIDGRDIGTVIAPFAEVKIFVTASEEERVRRRCAELAAQGERAEAAAVRAQIRDRDARERSRAVAPLTPADDAHLLDTTHLDIDAAVRAAIDSVEAVRAG
jgi:CMP/dCMP kinase